MGDVEEGAVRPLGVFSLEMEPKCTQQAESGKDCPTGGKSVDEDPAQQLSRPWTRYAMRALLLTVMILFTLLVIDLAMILHAKYSGEPMATILGIEINLHDRDVNIRPFPILIRHPFHLTPHPSHS